MTNEELDAIEARANAATAGPWSWQIDNASGTHANVREPDFADGTPGNHIIFMGHPGTAEFIAHAREDIPQLAAEVRRLREALGYFARLTRQGLLAQSQMPHAIEVLQAAGYTGLRDPNEPLVSRIVPKPEDERQ